MKLKYFAVFLLVSVAFIACESKPDGVLGDEKMVQVLTDIHITDAILNEKRIFDKNIKDTMSSYYDHVWVKNNISYQHFKTSINYYTRNTTELNIIYDSVISRLIHMRDSVRDRDQVELVKEGYKMNLWSQKSEWSIPDDGHDNMIFYKIITNNHGVYTLKAKIRMYPDDGSTVPRITVVAYYDDETYDASYDYGVVKDGQWHDHEAKVRTNEGKVLNRIAGWVLDHSQLQGHKHADIKDIELIYSSK